MHNSKIPSQDELPSKAKLFRSTILAIVIAAVILITLVLPAEYGIDPTGIGQRTGLKRMGEIKVSLATEAEAERVATLAAIESPAQATELIGTAEQSPDPQPSDSPSPGTQPDSNNDSKSDSKTIELGPDESTEIKLVMSKGDKAEFTWFTADGSEAFFDLHADSKELSINYHVYEKGTVARAEGVLEAAFNGSHGWYWKNRTQSVMTITLQVTGQYQAIKRFD